jgi:hypothetical protein
MMNDVIKDQKEQSRWDDFETALERVDETKAMPEREAPGAKQNQ